jgi:hypothetical protein
MTIITSVKVRDGLILGTDSMTQIVASGEAGAPAVLKAYSNARKLFQILDRPVGVMTYGLGNVGNRSIEGLVLDFCRTSEARAKTAGELAERLFEYVNRQYEPQFEGIEPLERPVLGFYLAGYAKDAPFPEEFEFVRPRDTGPSPARGADEFGASWRGFDAPSRASTKASIPTFCRLGWRKRVSPTMTWPISSRRKVSRRPSSSTGCPYRTP